MGSQAIAVREWASNLSRWMQAIRSPSRISRINCRTDNGPGCSGFCSSLIRRNSCTTSNGTRERNTKADLWSVKNGKNVKLNACKKNFETLNFWKRITYKMANSAPWPLDSMLRNVWARDRPRTLRWPKYRRSLFRLSPKPNVLFSEPRCAVFQESSDSCWVLEFSKHLRCISCNMNNRITTIIVICPSPVTNSDNVI